MNVLVIANTDVVRRDAIPNFQSTGWWYDYFSGDSIEVTSTTAALDLAPGEYHLYTDVRLQTPELLSTVDGTAGPLGGVDVWPNPVSAGQPMAAAFELGAAADLQARFVDMQGRTAAFQQLGQLSAGFNGVTLQSPTVPGMYILELSAGADRRTVPVMVR
jgi:hypothetical protein